MMTFSIHWMKSHDNSFKLYHVSKWNICKAITNLYLDWLSWSGFTIKINLIMQLHKYGKNYGNIEEFYFFELETRS